MNQRPTNVAAPIAIATGKKVLTLTSGIISSLANITPPIGVSRGDTCARARSHQRDALADRHADDLAQCRTER